MKIKQILKQFLQQFTIITTAIFLFSSIYIALFWGLTTTLDIYYLWGVIVIGAVCAALWIPPYLDRELSKVQTIVFTSLYLFFTNILVLYIGAKLGWFCLDNTIMIIGMEGTILTVFFIVNFVTYSMDLKSADMMNAQLKRRREEKQD